MNVNTYLTVNSVDKRNIDTSSKFTLNLKDPIRNVKSVELQSAIIPATYYNVTSSNNQIPNSSADVSVTPGNYSINSLCTAIGTAMNGRYIATYNPITMRVTLNCPSGSNVDFYFSNSNSIGPTIGFNQDLPNTNSTYIGTTAPKLFSTYLSISISEMNSVHTNVNAESSTFRIPINVNAGEVIEYRKNNSFKQKIIFEKPRNFTNLNVTLARRNPVTNQMEIVDLNGSDWSFILKFKYD